MILWIYKFKSWHSSFRLCLPLSSLIQHCRPAFYSSSCFQMTVTCHAILLPWSVFKKLCRCTQAYKNCFLYWLMSMHCGLGIYPLKGNVYIHEQDNHWKICKMLSQVTMLTPFKSELNLLKNINILVTAGLSWSHYKPVEKINKNKNYK